MICAARLQHITQTSADVAIPTPGARERAIMNQGLPRGAVAGEAIRMIMQLKGFPITYVTKGMGGKRPCQATMVSPR